LTKNPLTHSVSYFNLAGLSPPITPRSDGTGHSFMMFYYSKLWERMF